MHSSNTIRLLGFVVAQEPAQDANAPSVPTSTEESDECLAARVIDKDRDALAILFRRYSRLVRGIALRILGDASEADDLLQDVFLFVHRKVSVFDPNKASFRSWIVQMTYQRAIDRRPDRGPARYFDPTLFRGLYLRRDRPPARSVFWKHSQSLLSRLGQAAEADVPGQIA